MPNDAPLPVALAAAITQDFGAIEQVTANPRLASPKTYFVRTTSGTWVAKRMSDWRDPRQFARLYREIGAEIPCPELVTSIELPDHWFALFRYLAGVVLAPSDSRWGEMWQTAFDWLARLNAHPDGVSTWNLASRWLEQLEGAALDGPAARTLLQQLRSTVPGGRLALAHGDFAPQNILCTDGGFVLLDWEELGCAPVGFDAGWLLALNRIGAGPRRAQTQLRADLTALGYPAEHLRWFEGLGLLRMVFRIQGLQAAGMPSGLLGPLVERGIADYARGA